MFQEIEVAVLRKNIKGMVWGPSYDDNRFAFATK